MREFDLLERIYAANPSLGGQVLIPPGDDMAMIDIGGARLLAAVDQVVDGRHVRIERTPIEQVAYKAIARSASDIAAMAGRPIASLVAAVLPPDFGEERANALSNALRDAADRLNCPLVGGDIAFHSDVSHPLTLSVTVLAVPAVDRAITRSGARTGDRVYVTGALGGAVDPDGGGVHLTFQPRIEEAIELVTVLGDRLHAMIDISDGLGRDASHIARRSGVRLHLDAGAVPTRNDVDWRRAIADGEDYELCFTAVGDVPDVVGDVPVTEIGTVLERASDDRAMVIIQCGHEEITADELGWQHET
jgi:thiamine-monophosphate kinase